MHNEVQPETITGRVAFVGLGIMGGAMALRLVGAGFDVIGYDLNEASLVRLVEGGGRRAARISELGQDAAVAVVMVHNAQQVEDVLFGDGGLAASLAPQSVVWIASTVTPRYIRDLDRRLGELGLHLVDGPVSRGSGGDLSVFAAGSPAALDRARDVLGASAGRVFEVGAAGAGSAVKLINQLLTSAHIALTAEAMSLGQHCGVDPHQLIDVITQSAGASRQFERRAPRMIARDMTRHATIGTFLKDLDIVLEAAHALNVPTPLAVAVRQIFGMSSDAGHSADSETILMELYDQMKDDLTAQGVEPA